MADVQEGHDTKLNEGEAKQTNDTNTNTDVNKEGGDAVKEQQNDNNNNTTSGDNDKFDPVKGLNEDQLAALNKMREKTTKYFISDEEREYFHNDMCLLRYLRARDYNVKKAKKVCKFIHFLTSLCL